MESGKNRRLRRIFRTDGRTVIVPMDHGVSVGPIQGLEDMEKTISRITAGGADAVLVHAGIAKKVETDRVGLIIHLSGATRLTDDPNWKMQLSTVKEALRLAADAVSVHINVGSQKEQDMLEKFSKVVEECDDFGLPLLAMMYPRGPSIQNEHALDVVSHAARLGFELGADVVKTNYTGDVQSFREVVRSVKVPVVVAGGPRTKDALSLLRMVSDATKAGALGVSIGRNVFQDPDPATMTRALVGIVHDNRTPEEVFPTLSETNERILART